MVAPLLAREQVIGMMAVWREGPGQPFTQPDLDFLVGLSQQAAAGIENARLHDARDREKQYYEALVTLSPTAIVTMDPEERVTSWNPAAERLFGWSEAEAVGRGIDELVLGTEAEREEGESVTRQALEKGSGAYDDAPDPQGRYATRRRDPDAPAHPRRWAAGVSCSSTTTSLPPRRRRRGSAALPRSCRS